MTQFPIIPIIASFVFSRRRLFLLFFAIVTLVMLFFATQIQTDIGLKKLLPLEHPYIKTFIKYEKTFGGGNHILIAMITNQDSIFNKEFFHTLESVTNELYQIKEINGSSVSSLFTPNVRFVEVVENGFAGGNVIPADFRPTDEWFARIRKNIIKSGEIGKLVAADFKGAMVTAKLLEVDPATGKKIDYMAVAEKIETQIRSKYQTNQLQIHIIGFSRLMADIANASTSVIGFFVITLQFTALLLFLYTRSAPLTFLPLVTSLVAIIWQLGSISLLGLGIDPMSILVPFLVFAIAVSHGVQLINAVKMEVDAGIDAETAVRASFARLLVPGTLALASDTVGFLTLMLIDIDFIREMAITASVGVAMCIMTNLFLLPLLLSYAHIKPDRSGWRFVNKPDGINRWWNKLAHITERKHAFVVIAVCAFVFGVGLIKSQSLQIGDLQSGVPEMHENTRYNRDTAAIASHFMVGTDILTVVSETVKEGCIQYDLLNVIDRLSWHISNVPGVVSVISIPILARIATAEWNEGNLKWRELSRNTQVLGQAIAPFENIPMLMNSDCSLIPIHVYTEDHKSETISRVIRAISAFNEQNPNELIKFHIGTGTLSIMAATNDVVREAQVPMLIYVFIAIITLCLLTFRAIPAALCIVIPLSIVSIWVYAIMAMLDIGLKTYTLPVVALGVGIGVDYGIYLFSRMQAFLNTGSTLKTAYLKALKVTGSAIILTALILASGVCTWIFSALKFQVNMGILLSFMFLANMLFAILLMPALAAVFGVKARHGDSTALEHTKNIPDWQDWDKNQGRSS